MSNATAFRSRNIANSDPLPRFDLYRLPESEDYVVDVQSNHASTQLRTRVVAPLVPVAALGKLISDLNPVIRVGGRDHAFDA